MKNQVVKKSNLKINLLGETTQKNVAKNIHNQFSGEICRKPKKNSFKPQ